MITEWDILTRVIMMSHDAPNGSWSNWMSESRIVFMNALLICVAREKRQRAEEDRRKALYQRRSSGGRSEGKVSAKVSKGWVEEGQKLKKTTNMKMRRNFVYVMIDNILLVRFASLNNHFVRVVTETVARVSVSYLSIKHSSKTWSTNKVVFDSL